MGASIKHHHRAQAQGDRHGCKTKAPAKPRTPPKTAKVRITLDVTYRLRDGETVATLLEHLPGCLIGTVEEENILNVSNWTWKTCDVKAVDASALIDEDDLTAFMLERIEGGDLDEEDVPPRLARYALAGPVDVCIEMSERAKMLAKDEIMVSQVLPT